MRLTEKDIKETLERYKISKDFGFEDDLFDTIEAQQQEITRLKDDLNAFTHKEQCRAFAGLSTTVGDLQQEIQQLQAQNAELRDNLKWLKSISFSHEDDLKQWPGQETREAIEHALSGDCGKDYHNPADVEALKLAGEYIKNHRCYCKEDYKCIRCQTLSAIERAGGEK